MSLGKLSMTLNDRAESTLKRLWGIEASAAWIWVIGFLCLDHSIQKEKATQHTKGDGHMNIAKAARHEVPLSDARGRQEHTWNHRAWLPTASTAASCKESGIMNLLILGLTATAKSPSDTQRSVLLALGIVRMKGLRFPSSRAHWNLPLACRRSALWAMQDAVLKSKLSSMRWKDIAQLIL